MVRYTDIYIYVHICNIQIYTYMCTYVYGDCTCYAFLCVWCVCVCVRVYVRQTARDGDLFEQTLDAFAPLRPSHSCVCGVLIYMAFAPVMHFCVCVVCVCV